LLVWKTEKRRKRLTDATKEKIAFRLTEVSILPAATAAAAAALTEIMCWLY
jgi:hypothetical protein